MAYIHFEHVNKFFGSNHVLKDITLDIEGNELVTLLGPSGCGKSTLLRCLSGLESVTDGRIYLDGKDITMLPPKQRGVGMVFQQYSLFPNMTVGQNVAFGLKIQKRPKAEIERSTKEMLEIVGLGEKINQYPNQLSGGQQQRVALARALVTKPKVLLLDEPLSAIDALLRRNLQIEIRRIQQELHTTTIFVTHDQDEAMVMSDVIHLFNMGEIEQSGSPVDIYTKPETRFAAHFIGHYNIINAADLEAASAEELGVRSKDVAIRPEVIQISSEPICREPDTVVLQGTIASSVPHGNIIRYTVCREKITIQVDILFDSYLLFDNGATVYIAFKKRDCLPLR